ncbi:hypothetical protein SNEBB_000529 [Seison nebaliae]|nr:hypothetical protein SNEBB_000529 [Seison nebaliae]
MNAMITLQNSKEVRTIKKKQKMANNKKAEESLLDDEVVTNPINGKSRLVGRDFTNFSIDSQKRGLNKTSIHSKEKSLYDGSFSNSPKSHLGDLFNSFGSNISYDELISNSTTFRQGSNNFNYILTKEN